MTAINLLIVEDSADDAELMVRALRRAGVDPAYERVETAPAMEEALARRILGPGHLGLLAAAFQRARRAEAVAA